MGSNSLINLTTVAYLMSSVLVVFATERIMGVFFEKRRTSFLIMAASYLLYFISTSLAFLLLNIPIVILTIYLSFLFLITLNYESTMIRRITATSCTYLFIIFVDFLIYFIFTDFPIQLFELTEQPDLFVYLIGSLLLFSAGILLRTFKNIRKNTITLPIFWVSALVIPVLSTVLIILIGMHLPQNAAIAVVFITFTINVFAFYLHDTISAAYEDKIKSMLHTQEKEYYFAQCQLMQESVDRVKSIRHDMKLHLAALKNYTADNKVAADYLNHLLGDIGESEVYSDTGNISFDSIINFKLKNAKKDNIKLDINIFIPPALDMEVADVATILGNLLENALDAVAKTEEKIIYLDIAFDKGSLFIKLDNSFDGKVKYAEGSIREERVIVTRKGGEDHGHGLKNIRKSVEKYNGHMDISHEDNVFSVGILLYVGPSG